MTRGAGHKLLTELRSQAVPVRTQAASRQTAIQRFLQMGDKGTLDGSRLRPWFAAISQRLSRVIILNRSWESALTDSVLQQTPSSPKPEVGVFLDPPYRTTRKDGGKRSTGLYQGDTAGVSDDVATASYKWAVEHGERVPRRLLHARRRLRRPPMAGRWRRWDSAGTATKPRRKARWTASYSRRLACRLRWTRNRSLDGE